MQFMLKSCKSALELTTARIPLASEHALTQNNWTTQLALGAVAPGSTEEEGFSAGVTMSLCCGLYLSLYC